MNIVSIGRGNIGNGLATLWTAAGHDVAVLGRDGGDASNADVVLVAVPGTAIADALGKVDGLTGKIAIDATNIYAERSDRFASLSEEIRSFTDGPVAKSFNLNFASLLDQVAAQRVRPSSLYAADDDAPRCNRSAHHRRRVRPCLRRRDGPRPSPGGALVAPHRSEGRRPRLLPVRVPRRPVAGRFKSRGWWRVSDRPAVLAEGLVKHFGNVRALDGVDLEVPAGTVLGVLGPNGAGKTTAVRILTTLLPPDAGRAEVAGYDVVREAAAVRTVIGLAGQNAAVDENLTGLENLELVGRLYHLGRPEARRRAAELIERFALTDAADRTAKTYSGGMRRRLDLGASLVGGPQVLFLDEPTTGLDPQGRLDLWEVIEQLLSGGTTILLTTQYLEEADRLADSIAVIDRGQVIATGTADELKAKAGGSVVEVTVAGPDRIPAAIQALRRLTVGEPRADRQAGRINVPVQGDTLVLVDAVRLLDAAGVPVTDLSLHRPSLDDVFLALTGRGAEEAAEEAAEEEGAA